MCNHGEHGERHIEIVVLPRVPRVPRVPVVESSSGVELPVRRIVARELLLCQDRPYHLNRDAILFQDGIVEGPVGHLARIHQLFV